MYRLFGNSLRIFLQHIFYPYIFFIKEYLQSIYRKLNKFNTFLFKCIWIGKTNPLKEVIEFNEIFVKKLSYVFYCGKISHTLEISGVVLYFSQENLLKVWRLKGFSVIVNLSEIYSSVWLWYCLDMYQRALDMFFFSFWAMWGRSRKHVCFLWILLVL